MTIVRAIFNAQWFSSLVSAGPRANALAGVALGLMLAGTAGTVRSGRWPFRALLLAGAAVWPLPDHQLQGPVLVSLSYQHGVHLADLLSVLAVLIAVLPFPHRSRRQALHQDS